MDFNKLDETIKKQLYLEFSEYTRILGGKNFFLKMIEEIREIKPNPLMNKSASFHTSKVKISLSKSIYKDTFNTLFEAIRREDKTSDMLEGVEQKKYKETMNMMKTLKSTILTFELKDEKKESFSFSILDTSEEKKTKVTFAFKAIFFYNLNETKKVLNYNE